MMREDEEKRKSLKGWEVKGAKGNVGQGEEQGRAEIRKGKEKR